MPAVPRPTARRSVVIALAAAALAAACAALPWARAQEGAAPAAPPSAPAATSSAGDAASRIEVIVGYHLFEIRDLNMKSQSFVADFYMWMNFDCEDAELAKEVEAFEFMNGRLDTKEEVIRRREGRSTYVCWRVTGTFYLKADLRNYPFDTQRLDVIIEHPALELDKVVYRDDHRSYARGKSNPDTWGVRPGLEIPEFSFKRSERRSIGSTYDTDFGDRAAPAKETVYSRFIFSCYFVRDYKSYVYKIVIPLLVIIVMAYVALLLPPQEIQSASGLEITALLSTIAFNVTVSQNLPEIGYLVVSDKFFILTYVLLMLTLIQSVMAYVWLDAEKEAFARRWLKGCRLIFPVLDVAAFAFLMIQALAVT
jgi:hypothetical protein